MNLFAKAVAEVLEVDTVALDDDFRAFGGWCSLQGFGLLVMMENDFHAPVNVERFLEFEYSIGIFSKHIIVPTSSAIGRRASNISRFVFLVNSGSIYLSYQPYGRSGCITRYGVP